MKVPCRWININNTWVLTRRTSFPLFVRIPGNYSCNSPPVHMYTAALSQHNAQWHALLWSGDLGQPGAMHATAQFKAAMPIRAYQNNDKPARCMHVIYKHRVELV